MEEIRNVTIDAQGAIQDLGADVGGIGGIVAVIGEVAEQADLLALNAAIIAAQGGEQGRPFAVVAAEMKDLAGRVSAHTKEIEALISGVGEKATTAIATVQAGAERVEQGVDVAVQAGASLEAITLAARESESRMKEVVHAVTEQMRTTRHVVEQMEQLRNGVEQIGAARDDQDRSIEVVQACSQSLDEVARLTKEAIEVQGRDTVKINETIEAVGTSFETIRSALEEQSSACMQATSFIERSSEHTDANEGLARKLADVVRDLLQQAESMRDDVRRLNS
jgi:methyl-accepting chemotaxis protein